MNMLEIDGSQGEGGGQIFRTALSCGAMSGQPVRITRIRANRDKPGLKRQHLTGARAVAEICGGKLSGDELHSSELILEPGEIRGGDYHFAVGSAGSVVLVAQTVIPVLFKAATPSTVVIEGGTHVQGAPVFEFFNDVYLPQIRKMGCDVTATLERCGFFPAGGGRIRLDITPLRDAKPYAMLDAGALKGVEVVAIFSGIGAAIAKAEVEIIASHLEALNPVTKIREVNAACAGNAVYARFDYEHITEVFSAIGSLHVSRKEVAKSVVKRVRDYQKADQLLLPMLRLGDYGTFATCPWSLHATTNLKVISKFPNHFSFETRVAGNGITCVASS